MKKSELIDALEAASGQSKASIGAVLDALPAVVVAALREHGAMTLPGLLKIEAKTRAARTMRNPATGEAIEKPAVVVPQAKPVKMLKDSVAGFPAA